MKKYYSIFNLFVLCIITGLILSSCGGGVHQSANWQVTLKSAKFEKDFPVGTSTESGFVARMTIRYTGKSGKVVLPEIYLMTKDGKLNPYAVNSKTQFTDKMISMLVRDQKEYDLKKGDIVCEDMVSFFWNIDKDKGIQTLVVGDVSPFKVGSGGL